MTRAAGEYPLRAQLLTIIAGAAVAVAVLPIWRLEGRWLYVTIIGISLVCLSFVFIRRFADFLLAALFFAFPVASFTKWIGISSFPEKVANAAPHSGTLGVGVTEFILAGLYLVWFLRIFVTRTAKVEKLNAIDGFALAWLAAYLLSIPGTHNVRLGFFATEYLVVHLALYFYLSRNLEWRHVRWFMFALAFALVLEAGIGIGQAYYGIAPGLALDKGAGGDDLNFQYIVPGIEDRTRATGTLYDSHSLGLYAVMLLGYLMTLLYTPGMRRTVRIFSFATIMVGVVTLLVTYSRSAWLTGVIALGFGVLVHVFVWKERRILLAVFLLALASLPAVPWAVEIIIERFRAPSEIMSVRYELILVALDIWEKHFITGYGVGNYMYALDFYNFNWSEELPVHNMFLWVAAESGIIGLIVFTGLLYSISIRLWRCVRFGPDPLRRVALAALISIFAYVLDGMTNPLFRDLVVFKMFWFAAALAFSLPRLQREFRSGDPPKPLV